MDRRWSWFRRSSPATSKLTDNEGKLDAISRSQALIEFRPDGTILWANDNFLSLMGYSLAEVVGRHHSLFVDPSERTSDAYRAFWAKLGQGRFSRAEYRRRTKDGRSIWIQGSYNPVLGPDGKVSKVVKVASDITEAKLRAADFESQIAAIDRAQAVISFDLKGKILSANANFLGAMGYGLEEVIGKHHSMFVEPETRTSEDYRAFWRRLAAGEYFAAEYKRIGKGHREVWIQASYNPILDPSGVPYKVVKFATDITKAKQQSVDYAGQIAAIRKSQAVIEFAMSGDILSANDKFLAAMGYTAAEVIGRHHSMFVDPSYARGAEYREFWEDLNEGKFAAREFQRFGKDGRQVWIQASYNPILGLDGKPFKVVKFATDITAEVERRTIMNQLSLVANGTDNSVVITDARRRIEYVNAGFERLTGFSSAEVIGRSPGEVLQGQHTDQGTIKRIRDHLDHGQAFYEEILNYSKAGEPYWISLAINPVRDSSGKVERFISIQANVTSTKLRALEYTTKLDAIGHSNALAEWQVSGGLVTVNKAFDRWKAVASGEAVHLDRLLSSHELASLKGGKDLRREIAWPRIDAAPIHLDAVFLPMRDLNGTVNRVLMCAVDVSDRRSAVNETMRATQEVVRSGERIAEIVQNIDSISLQTNILALNAAVEATRAGEAGRGFAVVAAEVRALAQQSVAAARDINGLVVESRNRLAALTQSLARLDGTERHESGSAVRSGSAVDLAQGSDPRGRPARAA